MRVGRTLVTAAIAVALMPLSAGSHPVWEASERESPATATALPAYCSAIHNVGRMALPITNKGFFGHGLDGLYSRDCFTGNVVIPTEYPQRSYAIYMTTGAIWVGAVVDGDTLVSTAHDGVGWTEEFNPAEAP